MSCVSFTGSKVRPTVFVLTDGSGSGRSRVLSSYGLHRRTGATSGAIMGRFPDADLYRAIVSGDAFAVAQTTIVTLPAEEQLQDLARALSAASRSGLGMPPPYTRLMRTKQALLNSRALSAPVRLLYRIRKRLRV